MEPNPIYLDFNATTPLDESVIEVIGDSCRQFWANPSSSYQSGRKSKEVVDRARSQIGLMIGASNPDREITFTSGGTEANYLAMHSAIEEFRKWSSKNFNESLRPHVITTNIEHCATELPLKHWEETGIIEVTFVEVESGLVDPAKILTSIKSNTCLVTSIMANNETGVIQPISEISRIVSDLNRIRRSSGLFPILVHTDAAQTVGKVPVDVQQLQVDYLTIVGHKFYGPRIGALYHRIDVSPVHPVFIGGGQERGLRAGTENTPMIAGLGQAAALVSERLESDQIELKEKRDFLEKLLKETIGAENVFPNFEARGRLPNTSSVSFRDRSGFELLRSCRNRIEASTAAACHSGSSLSSVLTKSGLDQDRVRGTIRLSIGRSTTKEEIEKAVLYLKEAFERVG